ncbi:MAG TPA: hypothetical protein VHE78_10705 [Gemmatimonadaceae bacterium]|nr:hypothetical protein [Gemmatimonadaceae bacterium]
MPQLRYIVCAAAASLVLVACGTDRKAPTSPLHPPFSPQFDATPVNLPDTIAKMIATLYPEEEGQNSGDHLNDDAPVSARWKEIERKLAQGRDAVAQSEFAELARWMDNHIPRAATPPLGETKAHAVGRLVLYMSLAVYRVPAAQQPHTGPASDLAFAVATPTTTTKVVVPSGNAGVQIDPGSVSGPTVIVVSFNTTTYYGQNCSGPLDTKYCQYPMFYRFDEFPHTRLLKPGHFALCHVTPGTFRSFLDGQVHGPIDTRLVLAHTKPANPADYTPGGKVVDGIELLPRSTNPVPRFVKDGCNGVNYPTSAEGFGVLPDRMQPGAWGRAIELFSGLTGRLGKLVAPRDLYAFDQGIEHLSLDFSDFVAVDSGGHPDPGIANFSASGPQPPSELLVAHPGDTLRVSFQVTNRSLKNGGGSSATSTPTTVSIVVATDDALSTPAPGGPAMITQPVPALVPDQTPVSVASRAVPLPAAMAPGLYFIGAKLSPASGLSDANLANNTRRVLLYVVAAPTTPFATWRAEPAMTPRWGLSAVAVGTTIFAMGGSVGQTVVGSSLVETLDTGNPTQWLASASLPGGRIYGVGAATPGKAYFFGGWPGQQNYNKQTWIFDPASPSSWNTSAPEAPSDPPGGTDNWITGGGSVLYNGKIYVFSGADGSGGNTLLSFDPVSLSWTILPKVPNPGTHAFGAVGLINGKLYVAGGENSNGRVDVFDLSAGTWTLPEVSMPVVRKQGGAVVINNKMYVFGGVDQGNPVAPTDILQFDPATHVWSVVGQIPQARNLPGVTQVGGRVYLIGGYVAGAPVGTVISAVP